MYSYEIPKLIWADFESNPFRSTWVSILLDMSVGMWMLLLCLLTWEKEKVTRFQLE